MPYIAWACLRNATYACIFNIFLLTLVLVILQYIQVDGDKKKQVAKKATIAHMRASKSSKYFE